MYEEKIPFKRLGTVEEGYGQERQAAGKQIQILNTGNQTVTVKAGGAEGYVVGIPEGSITISDMTWNKWLNQITFGRKYLQEINSLLRIMESKRYRAVISR